MTRTERLLALLQILRRNRYPIRGATLAEELGISLRTLYRDIATLQMQGAQIEGEPGLGYLLNPCYMLPPLMFSEEEIEALVLGSRWVAKRADSRLGAASRDAIAKIAAVLPVDLRNKLDASALLIGPGQAIMGGDQEQALIRQAIRNLDFGQTLSKILTSRCIALTIQNESNNPCKSCSVSSTLLVVLSENNPSISSFLRCCISKIFSSTVPFVTNL